MTTSQDRVLAQIDAAVKRYEDARARSKYDDCSDLPDNEVAELVSLLAATLKRVSPPSSVYRQSCESLLEKYGIRGGTSAPAFAGMLKALRSDYSAGYIQEVNELVHASLFGDFLEMADHLLDEGYKDAAAVISGGALEAHLRKLCEKVGIPTEAGDQPKKADRLNADLAKDDVYPKLDQKSVIAWLDLRNKAAHAEYDKYAQEQVAMMTQGVRDFISRHPA